MAFSTSVSYVVTVNGGAANQFAFTVPYDGESAASVTIPASASNFAVNLAFDDASLQSFVMWANADMTVVFKDSGATTVATYTLVANNPVIWNVDQGVSNPFSAAVAQALVTSTAGGVLTIYAGNDI